MPSALRCCVDPANFVMDTVADVFPVDCRETKNPADLAWACVLILEAAVPALADPDPEIGARPAELGPPPGGRPPRALVRAGQIRRVLHGLEDERHPGKRVSPAQRAPLSRHCCRLPARF
jgi:hypothetical protein